MSNIPSASNPLRELWSRLADSFGQAPGSTSISSSSPSAAASTDAARDAAVERLPSPSVSLATVVARMDPVAAKLDQLKAAASGPYTVNGVTVYSGAQFRMSNGWNGAALNDRAVTSTVARVADKVGLGSSLYALQHGYADARQVVRLTQALIDDGQLESGSAKSLPDQIHDLQWRFAIGLDCAAYVYQAVTAVHGDPAKLGLAKPGSENFTGLPQNSRFAKIEAAKDVRPGDVLVLAGKGVAVGDPGHNVIVRSHAMLDPSSTVVTSRFPDAAKFMQTNGALHYFEVDSSFGADATGRPSGGVRTDVMVYNQTTLTWLTCRDTKPPMVTTGVVPYGEAGLTGFFRPRSAP